MTTNPQTEARALPELPDDDSDFTPDLARKIIEMYQTALAAKDAELAAVKADIETFWKPQFDDQCQRAERAEAQLAEANKALEEFADPENWVLGGRFDPNSSNFEAFSFARRAREAQGGENV